MLQRSTSSRRRRASRSAVNSTQGVPQDATSTPLGIRGHRRASLASDRPPSSAGNSQERSPRSVIVPNIALDEEEAGAACTEESVYLRRMLTDIAPNDSNIPRSGCPQQDEKNLSPRNSLVPEDYCRSPRGSLIAEPSRSPRNGSSADTCRSPRSSLVPDTSTRSPRQLQSPAPYAVQLSPRNSLVPDTAVGGYNRSPRNSLVPDGNCGQRGGAGGCNGTSETPQGSTKNSLMPDIGGPAGSAARGHRHSLACTTAENPPSPRGSYVSNREQDTGPRGSIWPDQPLRATTEVYRSPRGSIIPEANRSPRGSIAPFGETDCCLYPQRGTCASENRNLRGSVEQQHLDMERTPRGSLVGAQDRRSPRSAGLAFHEPRRSSADHGSPRNRSTSPCYRHREREASNAAGSTCCRYAGSCEAQVNLGYGSNTWADDSRRASSSVSQLSGDESRRLCAGISILTEKGDSGAGGGTLAVATYGSLAFQLKDAHVEASGTCDFVSRALSVVGKSLVVTACLACLSAMPLLMLIMGLQFIRDCPREPHIPVYMVVGGTLGGVRMLWALYAQIRSRRPEVPSAPGTTDPHMSSTRLASLALSGFLAAWFILGNFWILRIRWPDYAPTLFEPNRWCHKTLYIFALVHLGIVYIALAVSLFTAMVLAICRVLACPWPDRSTTYPEHIHVRTITGRD